MTPRPHSTAPAVARLRDSGWCGAEGEGDRHGGASPGPGSQSPHQPGYRHCRGGGSRTGRHRGRPHRDRPGHLRPAEGRRSVADHATGRRPRPSRRCAWPRQDQARRGDGHRARHERTPRPVHARPDAIRHPRLRGSRRERRRQAPLPLHQGPGLRPAPDGRRDQPRLAPHPVGAAAGDAGASRHRRRRALRSPRPLPCAGDAEPDRAGGHLSPARGAARPFPARDRRRLSRSRGRAPHPARDHRRLRAQAGAGDDGGDADVDAAAGASPAVGDAVVDAILDLVRSARPGEGSDNAITDKLAWGPGPAPASR